MGYQGHERRRHKVYITRNTEYHVRDGICVAVRDRRSLSFRGAHIALNLKLEGGVRLYNGTNGQLVKTLLPPGVAPPMPPMPPKK